MFGYLFYVGDCMKIVFLYCDGCGVIDDWMCVCDEVVLMFEVVVWFVEVVYVCYGFNDFKLKGGVFVGVSEIEVVMVFVECFFDVCVMFDLNGVWLFDEVVWLCWD